MQIRDTLPSPFRTYTGSCNLTLDKRSFDLAPFEFRLTSRGHGYIICEVPFFEITNNNLRQLSLETVEGQTKCGMTFRLTNCIIQSWCRIESTVITSDLMQLQFAVSEVKLNRQNATIQDAVYYLTNLGFMGTERYIEQSEHKYRNGWCTKVTVNNITIELRPLDDYQDTMQMLRHGGISGLTAKAIINTSHNADLSLNDSVANDLGTILSLACGTTVDWVYRELLDSSGEDVEIRSRNPRLKSYALSRIIDIYDGNVFRDFLQVTLPALPSAVTNWNFLAAMRLFIDAKSGDESLQSKGIKVVVCMELLKSAYLKRHPEQKHLTDSSSKINWREGLRNDIYKILNDVIEVKVDTELFSKAAIMIANKVHPPKISSFKTLLKAMCKEVGLEILDGELALIVKIRNELIHQGDYIYGDKTIGAPHAQNFCITQFMDKFMANILGYSKAHHIDEKTLAILMKNIPATGLPVSVEPHDSGTNAFFTELGKLQRWNPHPE